MLGVEAPASEAGGHLSPALSASLCVKPKTPSSVSESNWMAPISISRRIMAITVFLDKCFPTRDLDSRPSKVLHAQDNSVLVDLSWHLLRAQELQVVLPNAIDLGPCLVVAG